MGRAASTDRQSRPDVIRRRLDRAVARSHARIALRPHDPGTGEEIDKREIVKGYEYGSRGACRMPNVGYPRLNSSACAVVPMVAFLRIATSALSRGTIRLALALDFAGDNYNLPLAGLLLHTATIELGFTQESIFSSHETLRWREMDSNPRSPCGGWRLGVCDAIT